jgi:hypothetical protein
MKRPPLDVDTALRLGGWHPRYAKVMKLQTRGDVAFASIDSNGDGREVEEEYFVRDDEWWIIGTSSWGTGSDGSHAHGYAPGAHSVVVVYAGESHSVPVDEDGEWWFVGRVPAGWEGRMPPMPEAHPHYEASQD